MKKGERKNPTGARIVSYSSDGSAQGEPLGKDQWLRVDFGESDAIDIIVREDHIEVHHSEHSIYRMTIRPHVSNQIEVDLRCDWEIDKE